MDYEESLTEAVVREVREETGYDVEVGAPVAEHSFTAGGIARPGRPFKAVRVLFEARITGGRLGTIEVGGSTDHARWLPLDEVEQQPSRADIVDLGAALLRGGAS